MTPYKILWLPTLICWILTLSKAELTITDRNGQTHLLDGYAAHDDFFKQLEEQIGNEVRKAAERFLQYSKVDVDQLLANINSEEYTFLQIVDSLIAGDRGYTVQLLKLFSSLQSQGESQFTVSDWLRSNIAYPDDVMLAVATSIMAGAKSIPQSLTKEVMRLMDKSAVITEATKQGKADVIKWFLEQEPDVDLGCALEEAWLQKRADIVILLIQKNTTLRKLEIVNSANNNNETLLHLASESRTPLFVKNLILTGAIINNIDSNGSSALYRAVKNDDVVTTQLLITSGADVNIKTSSGNVALHAAARNGNFDIVKLLLESGAKIDNINENGLSPLHLSEGFVVREIIQNLFENKSIVLNIENEEIIELYLMTGQEYAPNLTKQNSNYYSILRNSEIVKYLLMREGKTLIRNEIKSQLLKITLRNGISIFPQCLINIGARLSRTTETNEILFTVIKHSMLDLTALMLDEGISANTKLNGTSALHAAADSGAVYIFFLLLKRGADMNSLTTTGSTVLHCACKGGKLPIIEHLLDHGLKVNVNDSYKNTPLFVAARHGQYDVVKFLLERGADINATNIQNQTIIFAAAIGGNVNVLNLLIDRGSSIEAKSSDGKTPLYIAAEYGNDEAVGTLIDRGASIDQTLGFTPLEVAVFKDHLKVVRILLDKGVNPGNRNGFGWTPLHIAVANGRLDIAKLLLDRGVYINALGWNGDTPLHIAADKEHLLDMVELLLARGHKVNLKSKLGKTPLDLALKRCNKSVIKLLMEKGAETSFVTKHNCKV